MRTGRRYIKVEDRRKDLFKIKQVAALLNTTPRTIRYYEQRGLLPPVKRTHGKMRLYTKTDVDIIRQIKQLQEEGKSLDEIKVEIAKVQQAVVTDRESNKVKILVDSTASIPFDLARQNNIEIIPLHVHIGGASFQDGLDITAEQLKTRVDEGRLLPESSPPTEEEFITMYTQLYENGAEHIISIHLSEKISDTVTIARKAASYIKDFKVTVIDAGTMAAGAALMAFSAAGVVMAGGAATDAVKEAESTVKNCSEAVVLNTLEKVVGKHQENDLLKLMLDFKPLLTVEAGALDLRSRCRNLIEAQDQMVRYCREKGPISHIIVIHANMPKEAQELLDRLEKVFINVKGIIFPASAVVAANLGNELLGVAFC